MTPVEKLCERLSHMLNWCLINLALWIIGTMVVLLLHAVFIDYLLVWVDANVMTLWLAAEVMGER